MSTYAIPTPPRIPGDSMLKTLEVQTLKVEDNVIVDGDITCNSLTATTTVTAGTAVIAGTTVTAGTGITATTGNIAASAGAVSANTTVSAGTTVTAGTGLTVTTGNATVSAGDVIITAASTGLTLTKGTQTIANFAAGAASVTARQGFITITDATLVGDAIGTITVTATGLVGSGNLIFIGINSRSATDGGPVLQVTARSTNTFTIVCKNADDAIAMTGSMVIGYIIM